MADHHELVSADAVTICRWLREGAVSPGQALEAVVARHKEVDGEINALPTLCLDRANAQTRASAGKAPLYGLPVPLKDVVQVAGVRTTFGSPIFAEHVPERSDYIVERLEASGGVVFAKSNTPEFACGGITFNSIFGNTRNPRNTDYTAGGSSGGAAAAVASRQAWLAMGSDFGGSLRIPASFCGVVGLRPTSGLLPRGPSEVPFDRYWVEGPIARTVPDAALLLNALAGQDCRDPLSVPTGTDYLAATKQRPDHVRIADIGSMGMGPVEPEVSEVVEQALAAVSDDRGWRLDRVAVDLSPTREIFALRRGLHYAACFTDLQRRFPDLLRKDIQDDLNRALDYDIADVPRIERTAGGLWHSVSGLFEEYDVLACPTVAIAPFRHEHSRITEICGEPLPTYYDWLRQTYAISMLGLPAISLPAGLTADGLPIGLQLVGRPYGEGQLLRVASAFEERLQFPT